MVPLEERQDYRDFLLASPRIIASSYRNPIDESVKDETRNLMKLILQRAGMMSAATVQLGSVVEDIENSIQMISRYPWHGTKIDKVTHLELSWFLFQNLCYKFKEKLKLVYNNQIAAARLLRMHDPSWLKLELSEANRIMGEEIRARGNTVHSWNEKQPAIDFFSIMHQLNSIRDSGHEVDLPDGALDLKSHYQDAKWELKVRAQRVHTEVYASFVRIISKHEPLPVWIVRRADQILDDVNSGNATLSRG